MIGLIILHVNALAGQEPIDIPVDTSQAIVVKKKLFISPVIGYSPETRLLFGVGGVYYLPPSKKVQHFNDSLGLANSYPTVLKLVAAYTLNKQITSNFSGDSYFKQNNYKLNYTISYFEFPDYFFGIGNYTDTADKERFNFDYFNIGINAQKLIRENSYAGLKTFFEYSKVYDIEPGGFFDTEEIPGENGGLNTGIGPWVTYDTRDHVYYPLTGINADASMVIHNEVIGSEYNYVDYTVEVSQFNKIKKDDVLAFNLYGKFLPGEPPFNRMAKLGGDVHMRGNYEGRFRDKNYITLQSEYRITFWKYFGINIFAGVGEVSDKFSNFSAAGLKYSIGAGGRLFIVPKDKISVRADLGFGSDGDYGFYISFREAF
ncbi:MAG: BamA/TamA family outer membrane protein [Chitinophagales bacterium]